MPKSRQGRTTPPAWLSNDAVTRDACGTGVTNPVPRGDAAAWVPSCAPARKRSGRGLQTPARTASPWERRLAATVPWGGGRCLDRAEPPGSLRFARSRRGRRAPTVGLPAGPTTSADRANLSPSQTRRTSLGAPNPLPARQSSPRPPLDRGGPMHLAPVRPIPEIVNRLANQTPKSRGPSRATQRSQALQTAISCHLLTLRVTTTGNLHGLDSTRDRSSQQNNSPDQLVGVLRQRVYRCISPGRELAG